MYNFTPSKLKQKLKYMDQIENEKMTSGIIVTRGTVTTTWHDVSLTRGKFLIKKLKKNNKKNLATNTWHPI